MIKNLVSHLIARLLFATLFCSSAFPLVSTADNSFSQGKMYQDFETGNGSDRYGWDINGAVVSPTADPQSSTSQVWKMEIPVGVRWGGTGIASQTDVWNFDFQPARNDRFQFRIWAAPIGGADVIEPVEVKVFDRSGHEFVVDTEQLPRFEQWTPITILLSQFPDEFDMEHVNKVELIYGQEGTYYFDDLSVALGDRVYQSFEKESCTQATADECGWASWNGSVEVVNDSVAIGEQAWKLSAINNPLDAEYDPAHPDIYSFQQAGTGIIAQQDTWHYALGPNHLDPQQHDRLTFWVNQQADNGMSNNILMKLFDHGNYNSVPAQFWTDKNGENGQWTKLSLPFSQLPDDFDLNDIDKIELEVFWPGVYYFDDLRAAALPEIKIDPTRFYDDIIAWAAVQEDARYTLQKSDAGLQGPWTTIYEGDATQVSLNQLTSAWLRIKWGVPSETGAVLVASDWSEAVPFYAKPVLINHARLQTGTLTWSVQPLAASYNVEAAGNMDGEWTENYSGALTTLSLTDSDIGKWFRVRAVGTSGSGDWSPALLYDPDGFVQAKGINLRYNKGNGDALQLKGVNLGNYLLLEPWMLGKGAEYEGEFRKANGKYYDDWTIREYLGANAQEILDFYQDAYIQDIDFDNIMRLGFNYVRLPIYYRNICDLDDASDWTCSEFNFDKIDEVVNACADRGIYVLLDLHGAPGGQGPEFNTGRTSTADLQSGYFHRLFDPEVETYRDRTLELWARIAEHYKDNTTVVGYDLLNEPTGFKDYPGGVTLLHNLYDAIYRKIRDFAGDTNHVIVMEGAWDWASLPLPADMGWENVMYEFHYYCWEPPGGEEPIAGESCPAYDIKYLQFIPEMKIDDVVSYHRAFINAKVAETRAAENRYGVPVLVGEFNAFGFKDAWEYYLSRFNAEGWSWSLWSYKTHSYPNNWGLFNHYLYDEALPDFENDSRADLERKFSKYDTAAHHIPNTSLIKAIAAARDQVDYDGDGLSDAVDTDIMVHSDAFNDDASNTLTSGLVVSRGNQLLSITDAPETSNGVFIKADTSGGANSAEVSVCSGTGKITLSASDEVQVTCGNFRVEVVNGPIEIELTGSSDENVTATLDNGDTIVFYPRLLRLDNYSSQPIVVTYQGIQIAIPANKSVFLKAHIWRLRLWHYFHKWWPDLQPLP